MIASLASISVRCINKLELMRQSEHCLNLCVEHDSTSTPQCPLRDVDK